MLILTMNLTDRDKNEELIKLSSFQFQLSAEFIRNVERYLAALKLKTIVFWLIT